MPAHVTISAIDLVYKIVQMARIKWAKEIEQLAQEMAEQKDTQILQRVMKACAVVSNIKNIERYDSLNFLELNIIRALLEDPQDYVVQLGWIRT